MAATKPPTFESENHAYRSYRSDYCRSVRIKLHSRQSEAD